jgi:hypothetical protein
MNKFVLLPVAMLSMVAACASSTERDEASETESTESALTNQCPNLSGEWYCVTDIGETYRTSEFQKIENGYVVYINGLHTNAYKKYDFPKYNSWSYGYTDGAWHPIGFVPGQSKGTCSNGVYRSEGVWDIPCCDEFCGDSCGYNAHLINEYTRVADTMHVKSTSLDPAGNATVSTSTCKQTYAKL